MPRVDGSPVLPTMISRPSFVTLEERYPTRYSFCAVCRVWCCRKEYRDVCFCVVVVVVAFYLWCCYCCWCCILQCVYCGLKRCFCCARAFSNLHRTSGRGRWVRRLISFYILRNDCLDSRCFSHVVELTHFVSVRSVGRSLLYSTPLSVGNKINPSLIAQRKCYGSQPKKAVIPEDKTPGGVWRWEVQLMDLLPADKVGESSKYLTCLLCFSWRYVSLPAPPLPTPIPPNASITQSRSNQPPLSFLFLPCQTNNTYKHRRAW